MAPSNPDFIDEETTAWRSWTIGSLLQGSSIVWDSKLMLFPLHKSGINELTNKSINDITVE